MEGSRRRRRDDSREPSLPIPSRPGSGVCMMNASWNDEQHPSFIHFISSFLSDFIFNNGGISVAFMFITAWNCDDISPVFSRVEKLKKQFRHFYVVVCLPTKEQNDSFNRSYFKYSMEIGSPTFMPAKDPEMGFEKMVKIAHAHGVCKRDNGILKMKIERERAVQSIDAFLRVVTSIPGIDNHDANALIQAVGSIEAISKASKNFILENTDLSEDKAERLVVFFRDPRYYLGPKIN